MLSRVIGESKIPIDTEIAEDLAQLYPSTTMAAAQLSSSQRTRSGFSRLYRTLAVRTKIRMWNIVVASRVPAKRAFDVVGSSIFLILFSPIFLATYFAIKLQDGGPAIFTQTRIGKYGKPFKFYKFRSMVTNAEDLKSKLMEYNEMKGVTFKMKNDPRITKVGRIIRKLSIDELPQLWCVLVGDMSLVGPRPPLPNEVALYENRHHYRLESIPGITCIWQVSGRNKIQFEDQVKLDVKYIHQRTLREDIKILFKTVRAVITARGAS
jgi:lipopolysaccharide/colanic/teichoic acid biosynthesis glycosyltransferase